MNGYGSHTFKMVNAAGEANFVKVKANLRKRFKRGFLYRL
jgi:catalase